MAAS
ncbi:hypothetical protein ECFDA517_1372, partial [Escherichia coli FDA517]|jgi:hypothetical protein